MTPRILISLAAAALLLAGCANDPYGRSPYQNNSGGINKAGIGTVAGAIGGGVLGHNIGKGKGAVIGTIAGTLLGAAIGNEVGASLDRADMAYYNNTSQTALETGRTGQVSQWRNPDSGNYGTITPTRTIDDGGRVCREYTQTIFVGGKKTEGYGRACRQPDGSWQIVE